MWKEDKFTANEKYQNKRKWSMPNAFVILLFMMFLAMIATWLVPSGEFERIEGPEGRMMVEPGSYHQIEADPVGLFGLLQAIPQGIDEAAMISATILIIGGTWEILNRSGAITSGIGALANLLGNSKFLLIPIMMIIFATIAAFIGALELAIVYIPIMLLICRMLQLDRLTAVAISLVATGGAFSASLTNPFTVGLGQQIVGLPLYSGIGFRLVVLTTFVLVGIIYVMIYANKIRKDPTKSLVYDGDEMFENDGTEDFVKVTTRHKFIWVTLIISFGLIVYGVLQLEWYLFEIGAIFFAVGILSGLISKISLNDMTDTFIKGAQGVLLAALVVGFARSILIIIESGGIIDTISLGIVYIVQGLPELITPVGMLLAQSLFNFVVNSGSGQVLITMPILSPVAELVNVNQQTTVLATQLGDGITNLIFPVSGVLMGCLAYGKVAYTKWLKFITPLIVIWLVLGSIFLIIAQIMDWGPF